MEKYLSIYLSTPNSRSLYNASDVIGVDMPDTTSVKIWYQTGASVTFLLSGAMAVNDNSAANYIAGLIGSAASGETEVPGSLTGITDALGAEVIIASGVIAA